MNNYLFSKWPSSVDKANKVYSLQAESPNEMEMRIDI